MAAVAAPPQQKIRVAPRALNVAASVVAILSVMLLLFGITTFPVVGNDEWWFTSRYDRGAVYGDWSDTVAFDQYMDNRHHPKFPPANAPLRLAAHAVTGVGAPLDRYLSAGEFIVVGVMLGMAARRLGAPLWGAILAVPMMLLIPTVFYIARSFRFEQDIFFLGGLSVLLVCRPLPDRWRGTLALGVSGGAAGMAASMHIFGVAFGGGILVAWALSRMLGQVPYGLTRYRFAWWVAAFALPVLATVAYFTADLDNTLAYYRGNARFEAAHLEQRQNTLRGLYPTPVPGLPDRVHVTVNALRVAMSPYTVGPLAGGINDALAGLWAVSFLVVMVGIPARCWSFRSQPRLPTNAHMTALVICWAATVLAAVISLLRPHADYAVYLIGLTGLSLFLLVATTRSQSTSELMVAASAAPRTASVLRTSVGWLLLVLLMGLGAASILPLVADPSRHVGSAQGTEIRAMRLVSAMAGLQPNATNRPPIYADTISWAGAGARFVPLYEYLISEVVEPREQYDAVVFRYSWYQTFVGRIATFTGEPIDPERRQGRMTHLLDGLSFSGALQQEYGPTRPPETRLWYARTVPGVPAFARITGDGQIEAARGVEVFDRTDADGPRAHGLVLPVRLPAGAYFAMVTGAGLPSLRLGLHAAGQPVALGLPSDSLPQEAVGAILWFSIDASQTDLALVVNTQGHSGPVRLRVWRTDWAPADGS